MVDAGKERKGIRLWAHKVREDTAREKVRIPTCFVHASKSSTFRLSNVESSHLNMVHPQMSAWGVYFKFWIFPDYKDFRNHINFLLLISFELKSEVFRGHKRISLVKVWFGNSTKISSPDTGGAYSRICHIERTLQ